LGLILFAGAAKYYSGQYKEFQKQISGLPSTHTATITILKGSLYNPAPEGARRLPFREFEAEIHGPEGENFEFHSMGENVTTSKGPALLGSNFELDKAAWAQGEPVTVKEGKSFRLKNVEVICHPAFKQVFVLKDYPPKEYEGINLPGVLFNVFLPSLVLCLLLARGSVLFVKWSWQHLMPDAGRNIRIMRR
jgi:hypothetical protein